MEIPKFYAISTAIKLLIVVKYISSIKMRRRKRAPYNPFNFVNLIKC